MLKYNWSPVHPTTTNHHLWMSGLKIFHYSAAVANCRLNNINHNLTQIKMVNVERKWLKVLRSARMRSVISHKQTVVAVLLFLNDSPPTHLLLFLDHHVNLLLQYSVPSLAVIMVGIMCKGVCLTCSSQLILSWKL